MTPKIQTEVTKLINEFLYKGFSEEESINMALHKIKAAKDRDPLVALYWEIEKELNKKIK